MAIRSAAASEAREENEKMLKREDIERREKEYLSEFACASVDSRGRVLNEEPCGFRTDFQRDRDRIIHSKAFRRLMHKTQVFLSPEGDHFRTRLTHTLEVAQISRTVARGLGLNEDLTEAIALGHDLGHTPFGHIGEAVLNEIHPGGFRHNIQSQRVVDLLEGNNGLNGRGLNLTYEVRDGIRNHSGSDIPFTLEGQVVRICDRVAYINHDIDDAIRSGVISLDDLPKECLKVLGKTHGTRVDTLVSDLIHESDGKPTVLQSDECREAMGELRQYMFSNVYHSDKVKRSEDLARVTEVVTTLYRYYLEHPDELPEDMLKLADEYGNAETVKDFVACMTDHYAMELYDTIVLGGKRQ